MSLNTKAILLVEDEEKDSQRIRLAFRQANVRRPVSVVRDGQQATSYLRGFAKYRDRSRYPIPCLIIIDLSLPGMNGFQLLSWLKMQPEFDQVPRVVLAASNEERDRKRAEELGCRGYFVKPSRQDELVEIIGVLARCGARSNARRLVLQGRLECKVQSAECRVLETA
jgi:DNA-binding response OmpR family regulator